MGRQCRIDALPQEEAVCGVYGRPRERKGDKDNSEFVLCYSSVAVRWEVQIDHSDRTMLIVACRDTMAVTEVV